MVLTGCFSAPLQIISLEPNRGSTSVAADAPIRVDFDKPANPASIAGRFHVDPPIPGCDLAGAFTAGSTAPCWIHWLPQDLGFELLHEGAVFAPGKRYAFTLSGGIADAAGDVNGLEHHWDVTSAPSPRVSAFSPGDGSTGVPVDTPLAVTFNSPMDGPTTAGAIGIEPASTGTRVVQNIRDHARFVVLPGHVLDPGTTYTIAVSGAARGEDGQVVAAPLSAHFVTGAHLGSAHALVLAGRPGEASTEVLLPALAPAAAGEPVPAPLVLRAARCAASSCGSLAQLAPLQTYGGAWVASDAQHVAVAVTDFGGAAPVSSLEVIDTTSNAVLADIAGAVRASWSPNGTLLAFAVGRAVDVLNTVTGTIRPVAADTSLVATPVWAGESTLVLSTGTSAAGHGRIELLDLVLGARYDLPGAPRGSIAAAVSPSGIRLAVVTARGEADIIPVAGAGGSQRLAGRIDVLGFTDDSTLAAVSHTADAAQLVRINIAGGDVLPVRLDVGIAEISTVMVGAGGRLLAFLAVDAGGTTQAYVANADGSGAVPLTRLLPGGVQAQSVDVAG